ncbi:MAG: hypothetical protein J5486_04865 [Bacteroidaceae bacterium]|nr:hypothetical protein [Bacteroidaceae bacterium]
MKPTQQTLQQVERALLKVAAKFPSGQDAVMTDILLQVKPDSGELLAFNDDMEELTRIVVDQWLEPTEENLYANAANVIKQCITHLKPQIEQMAILRPFSFVMIDEERETISDVYLVDDDTMMIDTELLKGLDEELDKFLVDLLKD